MHPSRPALLLAQIIGGILGRRALSAGADSMRNPREAPHSSNADFSSTWQGVMAPLVKSALGATPDFHHGLLAVDV